MYSDNDTGMKYFKFLMAHIKYFSSFEQSIHKHDVRTF